jgi:hypothetical protein
MEHSLSCRCGARRASFSFHDNIMPPEIISRLYCPECSGDRAFDPATMLADNGWVIEYDMDVAHFCSPKLPRHIAPLTPEALFDEGYATWRGIYPGDHIDSVREREEIVKLAKTNPRGYLVKIKTWATGRMERLAAEGWRKANAAQRV